MKKYLLKGVVLSLFISCGDTNIDKASEGYEFKSQIYRTSHGLNTYYVVEHEGYTTQIEFECSEGVCREYIEYFNIRRHKDGWIVLSSKELYYVVYKKKLNREGVKDEGVFFLLLICLLLTSTSSGVYLKSENYKDTKTNELREEK